MYVYLCVWMRVRVRVRVCVDFMFVFNFDISGDSQMRSYHPRKPRLGIILVSLVWELSSCGKYVDFTQNLFLYKFRYGKLA